jgi:hypothetical protein
MALISELGFRISELQKGLQWSVISEIPYPKSEISF